MMIGSSWNENLEYLEVYIYIWFDVIQDTRTPDVMMIYVCEVPCKLKVENYGC